MRSPPAALGKLRKDELLALAAQQGMHELEGLRRAELLDLLQRSLGRKRERGGRRSSPLVLAPNGRVMPRSVAELPRSPLQLDERLVLLARDERTLFAYATVAAKRLERSGALQLKLCVVTTAAGASPVALFVPTERWARSWYLPVLAPEQLHHLELGHRDARGRWRVLLRSGAIAAPAVEPAPVAAPHFGEYQPAGEHGAGEHGAGEHGAGEHGAGEHGASEHGASEHGASEHGTAKHGTVAYDAERSDVAGETPPTAAREETRWVVGGRLHSPLPAAAQASSRLSPPSAGRDGEPGGTRGSVAVELPLELYGPGPLRTPEGDHAPVARSRVGQLTGSDGRAWRRLLLHTSGRAGTSSAGASGAWSASGWPGSASGLGRALCAASTTNAAQPTNVAKAVSGATSTLGSRADATTSPSARRGALALVLHAHLPFVRHPEHEVFLEEDWLYEAIVECYLPLLALCERLAREGVRYRLTLALSPPLLAMLGDELLRDRTDRHLRWLRELADREAQRVGETPALRPVIAHYQARLQQAEALWRARGRDLPAAFARLEAAGHLDLLTCAATHGYLPLLGGEDAVRAQLRVAVSQHRAVLGRAPSGIWLPECAYAPGLDELLAGCGLRYFVADTHALLHARPRPRFGSAAPVLCADSGVAVFARDPRASEQVWSRQCGYPGDPAYRDFYRDIGWELPRPALAPLVPEEGPRKMTGLKYCAISGGGGGDDDDKTAYQPAAALQRAAEHAEHFVRERRAQLAASPAELEAPLLVAPYDAELFGHWWYEGPSWLEQVLRRCDEPAGPETVHLRGYLDAHPRQQLAQPAASSWGAGGQSAYWLNDDTAWIYPELHRAAERMSGLARRGATAPLERRALSQAGRELLLAQASDWPFLLHAGTARDYAHARVRSHLDAFGALAGQLEARSVDGALLGTLEQRDNIFPTLDPHAWL